MNRRAFLGTLPLASLVACQRAAGTPDVADGAGAALDGYGVQLYTLRSVIPVDVEGTLNALGEMGYRSVEFAGLYDVDPHDMRAMLDGAGLRAASSHHSIREVRERWEQTVVNAAELGQDLIVVPSLPTNERTPDGLRVIADDFNRAGEVARQHGLRFGYHNHDWEMRPLPSGEIPMTLLLEDTDPALVDWQMDIFWTVHGGGDAMEWLRAHSGRVTSVHVKDRTADGEMVDVGDGVIDFQTILSAALGMGLLHAFVEHDQPGGAMQSVERSINHLRSLRIASSGRPHAPGPHWDALFGERV